MEKKNTSPIEDAVPLMNSDVNVPISEDVGSITPRDPKRPTLLRRLRNGLKVTTMSLHAGYGVAVLLLSVGFGVFAVVDWIAQHLGIAIGEGVFITGAFIWVTRRYIDAQKTLKLASTSLDGVDEQMLEKVAYALRLFADRGLESVGIVLTVYVVPLAIKAPQLISVHLNIESMTGKAGLGGLAAVVLIGIGIAGKKKHDKVRQISSKRVDEIVDHVDDIPEFAWLDNFEGSKIDAESDSDVKHE